MTPAKAIARLRRLAEDWRREESRLCEQFGVVVVPQSMRARQIKDTKAIDAAVEMIERAEKMESALEAVLNSGLLSGQYTIHAKMADLVCAALEKSK